MDSVTLTNTALPLGVLGLLALIAPHWLTPRDARLQSAGTRAVLLTLAALTLLGTLIYAVLLLTQGFKLQNALAEAPSQTVALLLGRSSLMAMFWLPLLVLSWIGLAIRINKRHSDHVIETEGRQ